MKLLIGIIIGIIIGVFATALVVAGKDADRRMDEVMHRETEEE